MCGRFTLTVHQVGDVLEQLGAVIDEVHRGDYRPRYNVAPGDTHWMLRSKANQRELVPADWGLINNWSKDPSVAFKQINARSETLTERPAYRDAFARKRCIIPADGFYEWQGPRGQREPLRFHRPDASLMLFAGLYDGWEDPITGDFRRTFTIITTPPNDLVRPVHDRMPAIISLDDVEVWLTGDDPGGLLGPAPVKAMVSQRASTRVNTAGNDDPSCLIAEQLSLF